MNKAWVWRLLVPVMLVLLVGVSAHGVGEEDAGFLESNEGFAPAAYFYLGAKHMVTGYDHILFLVGVLFYLKGTRDVVGYVSMFTIGHSLTLLAGVLLDIPASSYLVDAIIGLSVSYKAIDNLGGFRGTAIERVDPKRIVLGFGLVHGFGLATKVQQYELSPTGLVGNLLAFNIGVEAGQVLALLFIFAGTTWMHRRGYMEPLKRPVNAFLLFAGFLLFGSQMVGYFLN